MSSVHYFVHLNLAISLLLAYIVFVSGLETAAGSRVSNLRENYTIYLYVYNIASNLIALVLM